MTQSRKLGLFLLCMGAAMSCVWLVPTVYGRLSARLAISEFRTERSQTIAWDRTRLRAYRRTLKQHFDTEAVLSIPRLHIEVPVLEGTSDLVLNRGVGHIAGTAAPGENGNIVTGHRDGFFRPLKDAARGDIIDLQGPDGTDHYIVRDMKIVSPSDIAVLAPNGENSLTLITCYPFYYVGSAPKRYVVLASRISTSRIPSSPIASNSATTLHPDFIPSGD
jgi:sortase A